jgi:hypothetical protein
VKAHVAAEEITYTGEQLRSLWIYRTFGIEGDAIVWFVGPCDVAGARLVDQMDARAGDFLKAARMLHLIVEHFNGDLDHAILRQRLLVCLAREVLADGIGALRRVGDDLFVGDRKLSVSIATVSPVSTLIHLGINIDPSGSPVPACGLDEFGLDPVRTGEKVAAAYIAEVKRMAKARCTVRGVP